MDFYFVEFECIAVCFRWKSESSSEPDRKKKVESQTQAVEFWRDSQSFVGHLPILCKQIEKRLLIHEIPIFGAGKCTAYKFAS